MKIPNQRGNILLFIVVGVTLITVLGTGIYFATTTSTFSGVSANDHNRAYQLALAGRDYALTKNLGDPASGNFTFSNGDIFRLVIIGDTITSTGIVKYDTPYEVKRTVITTKSGFSSRSDVSFASNIIDFKKTIPQLQTKSGLVTENELGQIEMGQTGTLSMLSFGGISYGGDASSGNCQNGICDFNGGFRAYFRFKVVKEGTGNPHGFVFTFFNGKNNSSTAIGGELSSGAGSDMPELLGYAGSSCMSRDNDSLPCKSFLDGAGGLGIRPPKIAIEFDSNQQGEDSACVQGSRCDLSRNHMAYVFWGDYDTTKCKYELSPTYDDNRHGNPASGGSASEPRNSIASNNLDTVDYFTGYNQSPQWSSTWLYNSAPTFAVRVEVSRGSTPNSNGNYFYRVKTWIKKCVRSDGSACDISETDCCSYGNADFENVKVTYTTALPNLDRTIELNSDNHALFDKFSFGWRFAAGLSSAENVIISSSGIYFIKEPGSCVNYGVWNNLGSTAYFKINGSGCTGVVKDSFISNIGASESIDGFTDAACTIVASPSSLSFSQASTADTNKNCAVYFTGTDK